MTPRAPRGLGARDDLCGERTRIRPIQRAGTCRPREQSLGDLHEDVPRCVDFQRSDLPGPGAQVVGHHRGAAAFEEVEGIWIGEDVAEEVER